MKTELLLSWWNLIFELPFGLGLMYLALYTVSGWTFGEADADADADAAFEHEVDVDHDIHSDADTHDSEGSAFLSALNWIGVGRMPLSLLLMILMLCWGTLGFVTVQLQVGQPIERVVCVAIVVAIVGSACITHFVSSIVGPLLFSGAHVSRRRHELLGSLGEALYPIDEKFGMVCGRDDRGELFQVACRVEEGHAPVAKGSPVQLVAYTAKERMFFVAPAEGSKTPRVVAGNRR